MHLHDLNRMSQSMMPHGTMRQRSKTHFCVSSEG